METKWIKVNGWTQDVESIIKKLRNEGWTVTIDCHTFRHHGEIRITRKKA